MPKSKSKSRRTSGRGAASFLYPFDKNNPFFTARLAARTAQFQPQDLIGAAVVHRLAVMDCHLAFLESSARDLIGFHEAPASRPTPDAPAATLAAGVLFTSSNPLKNCLQLDDSTATYANTDPSGRTGDEPNAPLTPPPSPSTLFSLASALKASSID